jgi:two-component system response regulator DctR
MDKKKLVIIVDDHPSLCSAVGGVLASAGYSVKTFASGEELLRHGISEAGCLLFDFVLPGMNGFELHEYLRARSTCPPVIFYTGHEDGDGHLRALALEAGALAFLRKPFDSDELLEAVTKAFATSKRSGNDDCGERAP